MDTYIPANFKASLTHLDMYALYIQSCYNTKVPVPLCIRRTQDLGEFSHTSNFYEVYKK